MEHDAHQHERRPLTGRYANGTPYARRPEVEKQVKDITSLTPDEWVRRSRVDTPSDPRYLYSETLVYAIQEARRDGNHAAVDALCEALLHRCKPILRRHLSSLKHDFDDAHAHCMRKMIEAILDLSSSHGDYYQVQFELTLKRLALSTFKDYCARQRRDTETLSIDVPEREDSASALELPAIDLSPEQRVLLRSALDAIVEPYRTAFVLRYYYRWPVEHADPSVPTISRYFDKTPRTVRNYLRQAEQALAQWRGDKA